MGSMMPVRMTELIRVLPLSIVTWLHQSCSRKAPNWQLFKMSWPRQPRRWRPARTRSSAPQRPARRRWAVSSSKLPLPKSATKRSS